MRQAEGVELGGNVNTRRKYLETGGGLLAAGRHRQGVAQACGG